MKLLRNASTLLLMLLAAGGTAALAKETELTGSEITSVLRDAVLTADGGVSQIFQASGVTFYLQGTAQSQGFWKVDGDAYCSQWPPNESWACYRVLRDRQRIVFVSASGARSEMEIPAKQH